MRKNIFSILEDGVESIFPQISFPAPHLLATLTVEWVRFSDVTRSNDSNSVESRNDQKL